MQMDPPDPNSGSRSRWVAGGLAFVLLMVGFAFLFYASTYRNIPVGLIGTFGLYWGFRFMRVFRTAGR